jgi:hypothetical protein
MEKSGCRWALAIISVVAISAFLFTGFGGGDPRMQQMQQQGDDTVVVVGETPISQRRIEEFTQQYLQGMQLPPAMEARLTGAALEQLINSGLVMEVVRQRNLDLSDATLRQIAREQIEEEIQNRRTQMVAANQVKPDATEAEFAEAFRQQYQQSPQEFREQFEAQITEILNDPARREMVLPQLANFVLMNDLERGVRLTEEEMMAQYNVYEGKRILLTRERNPNVDLVQRAQQIRAEIEGGQLTFEQAMERYSNEAPFEDKRVSENVYQVDGRTARLNPAYATIPKLQPGQVSEPLALSEGVVLFRLDQVKSEAPADLNKEQAMVSYRQEVAASELQAALREAEARTTIDWRSPGYEVLYQWYKLESDPENLRMDPAKREQTYREIVDRAGEAANQDRFGPRVAFMTQYAAFNSLYSAATPDARKEMEAERVKILGNILDVSESFDLRMEFTQALADQGDNDRAFSSLMIAARSLMGRYDQAGERQFTDVSGKLVAFRAQNVINAEQAAEVERALAEWRSERQEYEKYMKEQEEERKKAEEAAKRQAEEEAQPVPRGGDTPPPPPATTGAAPATTGN